MSRTKIASLAVLEEQELINKLENFHTRKSLEILSTFLPDQVLKAPKHDNRYQSHFVILLCIEISGITSLCEKHNKVGSGGTSLLTACLNAYIGTIIEVIHFYGGDVLKFTGDEIMACWRDMTHRSKILHEILVCAMYIQTTLGEYETEINVQLRMKISICYGDACFYVIGERGDKDLVVTGSVTEDIKFVQTISSSGDVVLSAATWRCLPVQFYRVTPLAQGYVKLLSIEYYNENEDQYREDGEKRALVNQLCEKHFDFRNILNRKKHFGDTATESDIYGLFVQSLPQRTSIKMAVKHWQPYDLKPYVMKLVQYQLDNRSSVTSLTESREITVQYINFIVAYKCNFINLLDGLYTKVHDVITQYLGVLVNISIMDKDITMLVAYGTKMCKQEYESKNALISAYKITQIATAFSDIKVVSIGVANGYVYSGVIGHPMRKEYVIIGKVVTRAAKFMISFPGKIVCDYKTYKNSKLSTQYFILLPSSVVKMEDSAVFEYKGVFDTEPVYCDVNLIGREDETNLILTIVNHPDKINYFGICFHGEQKIGKSSILQHSYLDLLKNKYTIISIELSKYTRRPYFCISNLYKQLYNLKSTIDSEEFVVVKDLPSDLWDFSEILQNTLHYKDSYIPVQRKFRVLSLFREITSNCEMKFVVIFIDNIQYIDQHSLDILETVIGEGCIRLISAGEFNEEFWDIRFRLSLNNHIKLFELSTISRMNIPKLLCKFMGVGGVCLKLLDAITEKCSLNPGLIESILLKMVREEIILINCVNDISTLSQCYYVTENNKPSAVIASISEDFDISAKINIQNLAVAFLQSLDHFNLDLVKVCSALSDIFSRSLLKLIFKYSFEKDFTTSIKLLFEDGIFECGSKYLNPEGLTFKKLVCFCNADGDGILEDRSLSCLPPFAFCQMIHFKNKLVKTLAYDLLTGEEKTHLHLKVTEVLESQNHSCINCIQNNSAPIVIIPKFREISFLCNKVINSMCDYFAKEINEQRQIVGENVWDSTDIIGTRRKIWDSTICSCLDTLVQVYTDLMYHSKKSDHFEKTIYFGMQRGFIMMLMNEFEEAINILNQADASCNSDVEIDKNFRDIHKAKINLLIAQSYLSLSDGTMAKKHLLVSLKEYEITIIASPTGYKFFQSSKINYEDDKIKLRNGMVQNDFGSCLNLVSSLFAYENDWEMAKVASNQCVSFLNDHLANISVLCDIYSNAISIYSYCGDEKTCERMEKCVSQYVLKKYDSNVIYDLFSISKLIYSIFHTRFVYANIETAIRLGYRAIDLNNSIHACRIQIDVILILTSALIIVKRIEDSVEAAAILYNIGRTVDEAALTAYFAYCLELVLETSFYLEPIENILIYANVYFNIALKNKLTLFEEAFVLNLYNYSLRNSRWGDIYKWKKYVDEIKFSCDSIQSVKNLYRFMETLMIAYIRIELTQKYVLEEEKKKLKSCLQRCKDVCIKWRIFRPRFYHLKAYYCRIMDKKGQVKKYWKRADQDADSQGNILERCWLTQSKNTWNGGFSFEGDKKFVEWRLAKMYNNLNWSQIMYGLPWHM